MRVVTLENSGQIYTSQVYLILGESSHLEDVNTLVDTGQDAAILTSIRKAPTGVGKWPVEQVVLTHNHSDHCALLPRILEAFHPKVLAFSPNTDGVSRVLRDGEFIKMGDEFFEVIHMPGHSSDSICLYNGTEGVLFAGDSPILIAHGAGAYEPGFLAAFEKLCARDVRIIFFGHGPPLLENCNQRVRESWKIAAGALRNEDKGAENGKTNR